jgi:hypothetical protein
LAVLAVDAVNPALGIDLPSGFTNLYIHQTANDTIGHSSDYKIIAATGAQSADWGTMTGSGFQSAKIATFKAAAGGGGGVQVGISVSPLFILGMS